MSNDTETHFDLDKTPLSVGHVTLNVSDLDRLSTFYQDAVGLKIHASTSGSVTLGADKAFLTLNAHPDAAPKSRKTPGLFHTAFLLPERSDLGAWIAHAIKRDLPVAGAADHNVSEALYLNDPEGNGIEIYVDRPVETWRGKDGAFHMPNDHLDINAIPKGSEWDGAPGKTRIGHVHLQTTAIPAAESFWADLGFDITTRYPGGTFFGNGGYHHQIAANVWAGEGHAPRNPDMLGLSELRLSSTEGVSKSVIDPSGVIVTVQ